MTDVQTITPDEYVLLPEDLTKYTVTLSTWRLSWQDMRAAQVSEGAAAERADSNLAILQKALKSCVVTLTNGQQRLLPDAALFPFPLLAEANKILKKAIEEASDSGN